MKLTHITTGQAGIHASSSAELGQALSTLRTAGYTVTDIEDDASEPWHVATIQYTGGAPALKILKQLMS